MGFRSLAYTGALLTAALGAAFLACSDDTAMNDAGPDVTPDTNVGPAAACIVPPTPAGFPTGSCPVPQPSSPDAFDQALGQVGLTRCTVQQNPMNMPNSVMNVFDKRQMPDYRALLQYPLRLPAYGNETASWLDAAMTSPTPVASAIAAASVRLNHATSTCPDPSWFIVDGTDPAPLTTALGNMASAYNASFDQAGTQMTLAQVPLKLQQALAVIVNALSAAGQTIQMARSASQGFLPYFLRAPDWIRGLYAYSWNAKQLAAWDGVDVGGMAQAAAWVATAVESVQLTQFAGMNFPPVTVGTPLGNIVLHGAGDDDYEPGKGYDNALLLLDTGGNDTYNVPVAATAQNTFLSIAVDLAGTDKYGYVPVPSNGDNVGHRLPSDATNGRPNGVSTSETLRQGAALLGVAMMWDYGTGNDTYRSLATSQGVGVFGVGVLYDQGGDDDYGAESLCQGGAGWGIGLLLDAAGNDKYLAYNSAQGFGFTQGFGALVDEAGNDSYYTDPGDPAVGGDALYANAQLPGTGNTSMSQGAGEGHRPDSPDPGYEFAGGMGVLRDAHGTDTYTTSVFGQATSFAMGIGMVLEGDGDDTYEGLWYVQGAAAHTGVSYFDDKAGNDKYDPTFPIRATSIGVGHDYSSVLHYDEAGDDQYHGPGLSLGSGYDNGVGLMLVVGGNDTFRADGLPALGSAANPDGFLNIRGTIQTLGVFVKASGTGTYTISGIDAGPGNTWSYTPENMKDGGTDAERSVGMDNPTGAASWP